MEEKQTNRSLKKFMQNGKVIPAVVAGVAALCVAAAVAIVVLWQDDNAWIFAAIAGGIGILALIALISWNLNYQAQIKAYFYEQAYRVSKHNIEALRDHSKGLRLYDNPEIEEFKEMNKTIRNMSEEFDSTTIAVKKIDFESCGVQFIGESENICEYTSLRDNITKLILNAQSFRNAVVSFSYDLGDECIKKKDAQNVIDLILAGLKYPNILVAENDNEQGFLAFIPYFDSVNQLNEELEELIQHISLIKRSLEGKEMVLCHVGVAVYPYSGVTDIMRDLGYAQKQTKLINFFIPDRPTRPNKDMLQSSMNLNNICKFYEKFSALKPDLDDVEGSFKQLRKIITEVNNYFRFSCCGMLEYSDVKDAYVCTYASNLNGRDIFQEGAVVRRKYIDALRRVADKDSTYYFSNRVHINNDIAQFIDVYEISSGQFFVIKSNDKVVAVLYFLNFDKEIGYDTYMRESLLVFSNFIGSFYKEIHDKRVNQVTAQSFSDVLKLSNTMLYTINPETHRLLFMSDAFKSCLPRAELGKQCFKTIYGMTAPCTDCPLKNKRKHMIQRIRRTDYETSIAFRSLDEHQCQLLVRPVDANCETRDRYDQDLLINTFYSFHDNMDNEFICQGDGYILLLTIDNIDEIMKAGNKAYVYCMRDLGQKIRDLNPNDDIVYLFRNDILAVALPSADKEVVIKFAEKIYNVSKQAKIKEGDEYYPLQLSYIACHYTNGIDSLDEYLRGIQKVIIDTRKNKGKELLQFVDDKYERLASREQHILELIDDALQNKKFKIKMQPVVDSITRRIYGAEMLIRLTDEFRGSLLNVSELIQIAEAYGRVPDISNSLINYIGSLYKTYGYTFFKSIGFDRLSINTDFSYFSDREFLEKINELAMKYSVPKNFLAFEITESDMYNSYEDFAQITQQVLSTNTTLICDQYTGELLTPEQMKELGFSEVKIPRRMIIGIESDEQKLSRIVELYEACRKQNLKVTVVGAETREQVDLLGSEMRELYIQGNYFYPPLEEDQLLDALRKANYYEERILKDE